MQKIAVSLSEAREQYPRLFMVLAAIVAMAFMSAASADMALAQTTDSNPFTDANDELEQFGMYGLVAGGVILGVIVGVRAGKAIYKSLSS